MEIIARSLGLALGAALLGLAPPASAVSIEWVTVGDPGNAADTEVQVDGTTGYGSVPYEYQIGKFPVTNAQYAEFLNAVAALGDPYGLYHPFMDRSMGANQGSGIVLGVDPSGFVYTPAAGRDNRPVNYVNFYDAIRFANWMYNGQGSGDTETGAYTLEGGTAIPSNGTSLTRNPGAQVFVPTEDEWYKAAWYDPLTTTWFDYPTGTDTLPTCAPPGPTPNTANCDGAVDNGTGGPVPGDLTDVGGYTASPSPNGTFDQGGNTFEWNETILEVGAAIPGPGRGYRGSSYIDNTDHLHAMQRNGLSPESEFAASGFRVASPIPEPGTALLLMTGLLILARRPCELRRS